MLFWGYGSAGVSFLDEKQSPDYSDRCNCFQDKLNSFLLKLRRKTSFCEILETILNLNAYVNLNVNFHIRIAPDSRRRNKADLKGKMQISEKNGIEFLLYMKSGKWHFLQQLEKFGQLF